jgi:hypothetical protein
MTLAWSTTRGLSSAFPGRDARPPEAAAHFPLDERRGALLPRSSSN